MPRHQFPAFNFTVQNTAEGTAEIHIDGVIVDAQTQEIYREWWGDETSVSFRSFRDQITALSATNIDIFINSPGGHVGDAMAMHDLIVDLRNGGKNIRTVGRGIIASAATYILMAGDSSMSENSWFMIHNVSGGAWGDVNEMERQVATMRKFNNRIRDFYAEATGLRAEDITKMMNAETWMTAAEAKEKGFVKNVTGSVTFTNSIARETWQFANTTVLNAYNSAVGKLPAAPDNSSSNILDEMKKFFNTWSATIANALRGVKAAENSDQQTLVNSMAGALETAMKDQGDAFENAVNEHIENALKGEAFTKAVNAAVENATKELTGKIANLEKANVDLEKELTTIKGGASGSGTLENEGKTPVVTGSWS